MDIWAKTYSCLIRNLRREHEVGAESVIPPPECFTIFYKMDANVTCKLSHCETIPVGYEMTPCSPFALHTDCLPAWNRSSL